MKLIERIKGRLLEVLFDEKLKCNACGRENFNGKYYCDKCINKLPYNGGYKCKKCGRFTLVDDAYCLSCKAEMPSFDGGISLFNYEGIIRRNIIEFKNGNQKYYAKIFASDIYEKFSKNLQNYDYIAYVPITENRYKIRGYNQAELLAKELSELSGIKVFRGLKKTKDTEEQKTLSRKERLKNLSGAFSVTTKAEIKGKKIILIDDVMATGSTLNSVSTLLKKCGAVEVLAVTVASVKDDLKVYKGENLSENCDK